MKPRLEKKFERVASRRASRRWLWSVLMSAMLVGICLQPQMLTAKDSNKAKATLTDKGITMAVSTDLLFDPGVSSHLIDVKTVEGIVTLSGTVDNIQSKERAVTIAKSIRGVRAVVDEMKVKPAARTDDQIRADIENALLRDPATDSYEVKVRVNDGIATLSGEVQSWQERQLSAEVAKGVRGVKNVKNEIAWKWTSNRSDAEIRADIERRLQSDIWVNDGLVSVSVQDGKVKLSGSAGSAIEKTYAARDSWVAGVEEVDDSALTIDPWLRDKARRSSRMPPAKTDDEIAKAVQDAFRYDPRVYSFNPTVEVNNGVVTLSGVVENLQAKRAAERDAQNTVGAWRVVNMLKVRPPNPPSDAEIAKEIRQALDASPFVDRFDVVVRVVNQKAYLSGLADSPFEKAEAGRVAESVGAVVEVQNNVDLRNYTYARFYPYAYPYWNYYAYNNRPLTLGTLDRSADTDRLLKQEIENQFFWSPFVDSDEVSVTVEDGVATLRGTVDSRMEQGAAIDNAYQAGAVSVRNELKVNGKSAS